MDGGCVSAVGWVPKGSARPDPKKYVPTEEEMAMMQEQGVEMADGTISFLFFSFLFFLPFILFFFFFVFSYFVVVF